MTEIMWWGYLHVDGSIHAKRWFGDVKDYTEDCEGNEFVECVVRPFPCLSREDATAMIRQRLGV